MNGRRRRLLMAQTIMGDGSGGTCPECGSKNTKCREEQHCEACGELIYEACHCFTCGLDYEHEYGCMCEDVHICPDCGTQMIWSEFKQGEWDWYCPECGA